jgi:hypothetical protein
MKGLKLKALKAANDDIYGFANLNHAPTHLSISGFLWLQIRLIVSHIFATPFLTRAPQKEMP